MIRTRYEHEYPALASPPRGSYRSWEAREWDHEETYADARWRNYPQDATTLRRRHSSYAPYPHASPSRARLPSLYDHLHGQQQHQAEYRKEVHCLPPREPQLPSIMVFSQPRAPTYRSYLPSRSWDDEHFAGFPRRSLSDSSIRRDVLYTSEHYTTRRSPTSVHEMDSNPAESEDDDAKKVVQERASRYLREIDRRKILARIANGEKQSALAREYKVSRSTICNLNKQRDVVLARKDENPFSRHPKKSRAVLAAMRAASSEATATSEEIQPSSDSDQDMVDHE